MSISGVCYLHRSQGICRPQLENPGSTGLIHSCSVGFTMEVATLVCKFKWRSPELNRYHK